MSKAPGFCLNTLWKTLEPHQKHQIVFQLGVITKQLSELQFDQAGSLFESEGQLAINVCLSRGLILNERYSLQDLARGPFRSEKEYYDAHISAFYDHLKSLPLSSHCFFAPIPEPADYHDDTLFHEASNWWSDFVTVQYKIDSCENRMDYIVAGDLLVKSFRRWNENFFRGFRNCFANRFALHHPDLSVNNIFVDAELKITCIIDWAFSSTVPLFVLLAAPSLPQKRSELDMSLLTAYEDGFHHALIERSCESASEEHLLYWMHRNSRPVWLFSKFIELESITDYHLFKSLLQLIDGRDDILGLHRSEQASQEHVSQLNEIAKDDATIEVITKSEKAYFRDDIRRLAVARKLTLISQWSSRYHPLQKHDIRKNGSAFIADKRLWKWLKRCL